MFNWENRLITSTAVLLGRPLEGDPVRAVARRVEPHLEVLGAPGARLPLEAERPRGRRAVGALSVFRKF